MGWSAKDVARAYILVHQAGLADPAVTEDDDLLAVSCESSKATAGECMP